MYNRQTDLSTAEPVSIAMIGAALAMVWTPWALLVLGLAYFILIVWIQ